MTFDRFRRTATRWRLAESPSQSGYLPHQRSRAGTCPRVLHRIVIRPTTARARNRVERTPRAYSAGHPNADWARLLLVCDRLRRAFIAGTARQDQRGAHRKQLNEHRRTRTPSNLFKSLDFRSGPSCVQDAGQRKQGVWKNQNPPHFRRFFDEPLAAADWWICKANPVENKPLSNLIGLGARPMGQQETYLRE